jgi:hypothetical protein
LKKAADILARVLDDKNRKLAQTYSSIFGSWEQIVGQSLAEHSRIYEIINKSLFIEVDHPGWMQLLLMRKQQILRVVSRKFTSLDVKDIRIKVNLNYSNTMPEKGQAPIVPSEGEFVVKEDQRQDIDRILSSVNQEELKSRLKRLFLKSIENETSGLKPDIGGGDSGTG